MKTFFASWIAIVFLSMGGIVGAQGERIFPFETFGRIVASRFSKRDHISPASAALEAEEPADADLPTPLSAAPPPDPEMPAWGQYLSPPNAPGAVMPREYNLIGPPRGVVQNINGQDYQAVVADPNVVAGMDTQFDQTINIFRPDGIAPIGVFGDHTLPAGKAFISYRYLQNSFDQNYLGSSRIGPPTAFPFAPRQAMQNSQVVLVEYGATQELTVLALLPFQHNQINFLTAGGGDYKATFTNPGDIRIMALLAVARSEQSQQHVNLGMSLPVGFLEDAKTFGGAAPAPSPVVPDLPYQIRTSSGTYDVLLGYTYRRQTDCWTWGGQINAVIPTGKNTLGYELGNQLQETAWLSRRWSDRWSTSARLDAHQVGNIRGADSRLNTALSPVNQTGTQGYQNLNALLGVNYLFTRPGHRIEEQRLFLEAGVPLYQWLDGPQLGVSWILNAGWGMAF